jgi:diaminopimelate decarboxylase
MFNVESAPELTLLSQVATTLGKRAPIAIRVNPEVDPKTHPYIATGLRESKFGLPIDDALGLYRHATTLSGIDVAGIAFHIGSQILSLEPFAQAIDRVLEVVAKLRDERIPLRSIDVGGGLGVPYAGETPPDPAAYGALVQQKLAGAGVDVLLEPGRVLVANAGVLLTRVHYVKRTAYKTFVIVDAAMNDLMRPALYQAHHHIEPVRQKTNKVATVDVVGPVCESSDFFAKNREMPEAEAGDLLCVRTAGAYGFAMASQYNSRVRPAEVIVSGDRVQVLRERETVEQLWRGEARLEGSM